MPQSSLICLISMSISSNLPNSYISCGVMIILGFSDRICAPISRILFPSYSPRYTNCLTATVSYTLYLLTGYLSFGIGDALCLSPLWKVAPPSCPLWVQNFLMQCSKILSWHWLCINGLRIFICQAKICTFLIPSASFCS